MNTTKIILAVIIVLGPLIFVHELGHFLFAKLFGVRVLKFSMGFGPKIIGKVIGGTEYVLSAIPLGGYVKMFGENPDEQNVSSVDKEASFAHKKVWQRFFIVLAGPVFNLLFCVGLFFVIFLFVGQPTQVDSTHIKEVTESSPAQRSGLLEGDEIVEINGQPTKGWLDVLNGVKESEGQQITIVVQRAEKKIEIFVTPERNGERYLIGIVGAGELIYTDVSFYDSVRYSFAQTWEYVSIIGFGVAQLIQSKVSASELGGPILIAQIAAKQMEAGWLSLLSFMGLLSVNLGLLNLLPIPVLDGGHLVFLTFEGITRKPVNERVQIIAQQIGICLLGTLMIFVFYNDIVR